MTLDDEDMARMSASPLTVVSQPEIAVIAQRASNAEALASAIFDYAVICWQRGRRFERARAADASPRWWHLGGLLRGW